MWHVLLDHLHGLTYEILGIRPLLIDKLSSILIPKDGAPLPRMDSCSSVLPVIVDPFIVRGCNYCGLRRTTLTAEAKAGDDRALELFLATNKGGENFFICTYRLSYSYYEGFILCRSAQTYLQLCLGAKIVPLSSAWT